MTTVYHTFHGGACHRDDEGNLVCVCRPIIVEREVGESPGLWPGRTTHREKSLNTDTAS